MSESSKPDGTDPRILQPEGKEVLIAKSSNQNGNRRYHKKDGCQAVPEMARDPKVVDIAVAKWKGLTPCVHCFDGQHDGYAPTLTGPQVDEIKAELVSGKNLKDVAPDFDTTPTTIREHIHEKRDYDYLTEPQADPIEWRNNKWVWSDE